MISRKQRSEIRLQSKRNVELWIYSFADMYMIMSVFFIALSVIYAAKIKEKHKPIIEEHVVSAGRGPASVVSDVQVRFEAASASLTPDAIQELKIFLPVLKSVKKGIVDIEGYADMAKLNPDSEFTSNLDLSTRRAVTVAEWLIKNGVSPAKVRTFAYGDSRIFSKSKVGTNRRVVIKVATEGVPE